VTPDEVAALAAGERSRAVDELARIETWCVTLRKDFLARAKGELEVIHVDPEGEPDLQSFVFAVLASSTMERLDGFRARVSELPADQRDRARSAIATKWRREFGGAVDELSTLAFTIRQSLIAGFEVTHSYGEVIMWACTLGFMTWADHVKHSERARISAPKASAEKSRQAAARHAKIRAVAEDIRREHPKWNNDGVAAEIVHLGLGEGLSQRTIRKAISRPTPLAKS
jgi:hypothetical protein